MTRTTSVVAICLAFAGITGGVFVGASGLDTVVGCGVPDHTYPDQSARDWVTQADHVVVGTPVQEEDTGRRDFTKGPVGHQTDRKVTFRTDRLLWSAGRPRQSLGRSFDLVAPGWSVMRQSGDRIKRTTGDAPRLETGHTYLLALRWSGGRWAVLGEGASVPFDGHTAGRGEWCGRVLGTEDVARGELFSRSDDHSLEKSLLGQGEEAVVRALDRAARK
ncbi:hypothetical protein [Streptomyces sp. NRRL S-340]|uniref:hypothetical protein n=1 Tax=Streptomyces sp. NRRL S-340 TaxID=1463901 RepID=UPI000569439C|nr:hypothetical protein [Streptomyces sp. NRRL S-340]